MNGRSVNTDLGDGAIKLLLGSVTTADAVDNVTAAFVVVDYAAEAADNRTIAAVAD